MEYRWINGVKTSLLGYGCMRFPQQKDGKIHFEATEKLLDTAYANGVNYFDTAYNYHGGESEVVVGKILGKYPRDSYCIATKLPYWEINTPEDVSRVFEEQCKRLNKDYIDFYLLHALNREAFDKLVRLGALETCQRLQQEGKIRQLGFSFHDSYEAFSYILNYRKWDFCQIQYNYMDIDLQAGSKGYALAKEKGIPLVIMEPLKGGRLAKLPPKVQDILSRSVEGRSASAWSLKWLAAHDNVGVILSGMTTMEALLENLTTLSDTATFTPEEEQTVGDVRQAILARVKNGCTGCGYCMPCPGGVDIPGNFRAWNNFAMYEDCTPSQSKFFTRGPIVENGPEKCLNCGKCETMCPQHIEIRKDLVKITGEKAQ